MELRNLRAFRAVIDTGSFSQAAKSLHTTQPTISKSIAQLEHDCGIPLLNRTNRSFQITAAGELVYRRCQAILSEHAELLNDLAELKGLTRGALRLGIPPMGSGPLFAAHLAEYRRRHPKVTLDLREEGSDRLKEDLRSGEIEMGAALLPAGEDYDHQTVCRTPIVALLPLHHPLASRDRLKLTDLAADPFILFEASFALNALLIKACQQRGFTPVEATRSAHADFIAALVASGLGIGFLPQIVASFHQLQAVHVIPIDEPDLEWHIGLIWRKGTHLSPAAQSWLRLIQDATPVKNQHLTPQDH